MWPFQPEIEKRVLHLMRSRDSKLIDRELRSHDPNKLSGKNQEAWYYYMGATAYAQKDHSSALKMYTDGHTLFPKSDRIRFGLGQEYEYLGESQKMLDLFMGIRTLTGIVHHIVAASRYCYLWDYLDEGEEILNPVAEMYIKGGIGDDHRVYMGGLPFIWEVWGTFICYAVLKNDYGKIEELTSRARQNISDYDFTTEKWFIKACKDKDYNILLNRAQIDLENFMRVLKSPFPGADFEVRMACYKSLITNNPTEALRILNKVVVGPSDHQWFNDVLLLHKARVAHGSGEVDKEKELVDQFIKKQPLLLEPHHAVNYGLIDYQEILKKEYREKRTSRINAGSIGY
jgi:hypothetical protein